MLLADFAQVADGKLTVVGGGWSLTGPEPTPFGIAILVHVPWDQANRRHTLRLELVDADGEPVTVPGDEDGEEAPIVFLDPNMMGGILLYAFAAALVGGVDSPGGAVFGGFLVGVLENVLGAFVIGNELKLAVALVLIIGVLVVKPSGFFGKVHVNRV